MTNPTADQTLTAALLDTVDREGGPSLDSLVPVVYEELRAIAHRQLRDERGGHTLDTTALVHETYLRLVGDCRVTQRGRAYFFGAAARAMRQILVDCARRKGAQKRGGAAAPVTLEDHHSPVDGFAAELLDLEVALQRLAAHGPRQAQVVELRYFGGMDVRDVAAVLGISTRTVELDWAMARAWLFRELGGGKERTGHGRTP